MGVNPNVRVAHQQESTQSKVSGNLGGTHMGRIWEGMFTPSVFLTAFKCACNSTAKE